MSEEVKNDNILAEMEKTIDSMSEENQEENQETAEVAAAEAGKEAEASSSEAFTVDDALIERGVKAGLSIATVKGFTSAEMADQILTALESKSDPNPKPNGQEASDGEDTPAIDLSEFTEENGYEASLVKILGSMKSVIEEQGKTIKALKSAGASADADSFFTAQFDGLESGVKSHVDAAKKSQLKAKFDFLEKAYKASGAKISREDIFKEAKTLVLGDLVQRVAAENKEAQLKKRAGLRLAPAGGSSAIKKVSQEDKEAEILQELREKFKLNG